MVIFATVVRGVVVAVAVEMVVAAVVLSGCYECAGGEFVRRVCVSVCVFRLTVILIGRSTFTEPDLPRRNENCGKVRLYFFLFPRFRNGSGPDCHV
jgi:hypothetical protein